jgi:AbrB family looped-hinge helix DNA binding protein
MNAQTKLSTKGQVVLPTDVRESLGLVPGQSFNVRVEGRRIILEETQLAKKGSFFDLIGPSPYKGPPMSVEDMDAGIAKAVATRNRRSLGKA